MTPRHHLPDPALHGNIRNPTRHSALHAPFPHVSHITPAPNSTSVELYGNYRITGPAEIYKLGDALIARLFPMGHIDAMDGGTCDTLCVETLDCDDDQPCNLIAEHIELRGDFSRVAGLRRVNPVAVRGVHTLDNKCVLTVRHLPDHTHILLQAGAQLNHPVNMNR